MMQNSIYRTKERLGDEEKEREWIWYLRNWAIRCGRFELRWNCIKHFIIIIIRIMIEEKIESICWISNEFLDHRRWSLHICMDRKRCAERSFLKKKFIDREPMLHNKMLISGYRLSLYMNYKYIYIGGFW